MRHYIINLLTIYFITFLKGSLGGPISAKCLEDEMKKFGTQWNKYENDSSRYGLVLPSYEDVFDGYGIKISYITGEMQLVGADNFTVDAVSVTPNKSGASMNVSFPALTLTSSNYSLKGRAYSIYPLTGAGMMNITFEDLSGFIEARFIPKGLGSEVSYMEFDFDVKNIKIFLEGSSWPINKVLNSQALKIVQSYRNNIITLAKVNMKLFCDLYFATTTTEQAMDTGNCLLNNEKYVTSL